MQTFLPYPSFLWSSIILDQKRLNKQIIETAQIHDTLLHGGRWENHPAVRMWSGYEDALILYGWHMYFELQLLYRVNKRGGVEKHKSGEYILSIAMDKKLTLTHKIYGFMNRIEAPPWLGQEDFHASHRSNLLRKKPEYYRKFWPHEPDNLPYVWPV